MIQVITFFGWLLLGVGLTLFVFGHLSMAFVYNVAYVAEALWPSDDTLSSLWALPVALAPGLFLLGIGKWMERFGKNSDDGEAEGEPLPKRSPTPSLNPPSHHQS